MPEHSPLHRPPVGGEYYVFRDPVHNLIEIEDDTEGRLLRRVLRTKEMQRLRFLSQNGLAKFVYPSLEGTRFPHALGTYNIARTLIRALRDRQADDAAFPISLRIKEQDLIAFPLAALFHDIGHGPLSHVWEQCFKCPDFETYNHEKVSLAILQSSDTELGHYLANGLSTDFPMYTNLRADIVSFLTGKHRLYYLAGLLSGNLDVDRLDFMARDTRNAGVTYGFHDLDWIIRSFRFARLRPELVDGKEKESFKEPFWTIAIDGRKGLNTLVQFLHARENMYSLVYLHKTARSATMVLIKALFRAAELVRSGRDIPILNPALKLALEKQSLSAVNAVELDDNSVWEQLKIWARGMEGEIVLPELARRILSRSLYKVFIIKEHTYKLLKQLDGPIGNHLSQIIKAKIGVSDELCKYYYAFDSTSFNKVGSPSSIENSVWIMEEGMGSHRFSTLQHYWSNRGENLDVSYYYFMVDERCVEEINLIIDRLQVAGDHAVKVKPNQVPASHRLLAALGKEGVWKSVYLGTTAEAGDDEGTIMALKCYKHEKTAADAIQRDVRQINILLDGIDGSDYLSKAKFIGRKSGKIWLSEKLWSSSLFDWVSSVGPVRDLYEIAKIGQDLARGLAAIHTKNLRHTDIKPENCGVIRIGASQRYVLGDFGCVSLHPNTAPSDVRLQGTQRTRAPEVFQYWDYSLKADVWALGATIYALCRLRYPFMAFQEPHGTDGERAAREARIRDEIPTLLDLFTVDCGNNLPPAISQMIGGCFLGNAERWTAQRLALECGRLLSELEALQEAGAKERKAWQRAEDFVAQAEIVRLRDAEEVDYLSGMERYIPRSTLEKVKRCA